MTTLSQLSIVSVDTIKPLCSKSGINVTLTDLDAV